MKADKDHAQVRIPPPLLLIACMLLGIGLHRLYPLHFLPRLPRWSLGVLLIGAGLGVSLYCVWMFRIAQTALEPWEPTSHIVRTGPYRWTRNPIYLSFVLMGVGAACALDNLWIALMQIPLVVLITRWVIKKEEAYLEQKFGESYLAYKNHVRRWI